jgi:hypothetical protein
MPGNINTTIKYMSTNSRSNRGWRYTYDNAQGIGKLKHLLVAVRVQKETRIKAEEIEKKKLRC